MDYPIANIEERLGKFFLIRCKSQPNLVLEIKDSLNKPSVPLVLGHVENDGDAQDHQLWFMDRSTFTLRSKLNSFCIDFNTGDDLVAQPFMGSKSQQWDVQEDGAIIEKDFDNVISVRNDFIVPGTSCHVTSFEGFPGQGWCLHYLPATYFAIRHHETSKVLDIRGDLAIVGAQVITYAPKDPVGDNQLWYEDQNGVIHSKMNDYVINVIDMDVLMYPYNTNNSKQRWVINGSLIQDRCLPSRVLDVRPVMFQTYGNVLAAENNSSKSQLWSFEDVSINSYIYDHDGKGKYFLIYQPHFNVIVTVNVKAGTPPFQTYLSRLMLQPNGRFDDSQLFYMDPLYNVIRSKANERLCLEVEDSSLMLSSYQTNHPSQQLEYKDDKLFHKKEGSPVLTLGTTSEPCDPGSMQCYFVEDIDSHHQRWTLRHATAEPFFIETKAGGKILEARREGHSSCSVALVDRKHQTRSAHQLWYEDELGILRSKLNGFVLDFSYGTLHTDRQNSVNPHQGWVVSKDHIRNRNSGLVLDTCGHKKWIGNSIGPSENKFTDSQRWVFMYA